MRRRAQSDATGLVGSDSSHRLIAQATGGEALLMTPARKDVPSVTLTVPDAAAAPISDSSRRAALLAEVCFCDVGDVLSY